VPGALEPGALEPGALEPGDLEPGALEPGTLGHGARATGFGARTADSANEIKGLGPPAPRTDARRSLGGGFGSVPWK
jgi:hypothetical protein